jgi:hypothetical protein
MSARRLRNLNFLKHGTPPVPLTLLASHALLSPQASKSIWGFAESQVDMLLNTSREFWLLITCFNGGVAV